jgi:hypothetical protein
VLAFVQFLPPNFFKNHRKWLISLKKIRSNCLQMPDFLIKWKKVQLSGEKCIFEFETHVPRRLLSQPRCQGPLVGAHTTP